MTLDLLFGPKAFCREGQARLICIWTELSLRKGTEQPYRLEAVLRQVREVSVCLVEPSA